MPLTVNRTLSDLPLAPVKARVGSRVRVSLPVVAVLFGKPAFIIGYAEDVKSAARVGRDNRLAFSEVFTGRQRGTGRSFFALRP